jgi:choline dehydrogenase-like flavoprotein
MRALAVALLLTVASGASWGAQQMTDEQIRQTLIQASIASYTGNCPCPYNTMRNGRRCSANSAYSKPGGAAPLCYPQDVSQAMVDAFRARTGIR